MEDQQEQISDIKPEPNEKPLQKKCKNGIWDEPIIGNTFVERQEYLLNSGIRSDVTFLVGKDKAEVKGHKIILSTGSPVFLQMFARDETVSRFSIPEIEPCDFTLFLKV